MGMYPKWYLIKPNDDLDHELASQPTEIPNGYRIRCEERIETREGYGTHHLESGDNIGTSLEVSRLMGFDNHIVVEGSSLAIINKLRAELKKIIGVKVGTI